MPLASTTKRPSTLRTFCSRELAPRMVAWLGSRHDGPELDALGHDAGVDDHGPDPRDDLVETDRDAGRRVADDADARVDREDVDRHRDRLGPGARGAPPERSMLARKLSLVSWSATSCGAWNSMWSTTPGASSSAPPSGAPRTSMGTGASQERVASEMARPAYSTDGQPERRELERPVAEQQAAAARSLRGPAAACASPSATRSASSRPRWPAEASTHGRRRPTSPAPEQARRVAGAAHARRGRAMKRPPSARLMAPLSSLTTMTSASVCSEMPMAARWRVP